MTSTTTVFLLAAVLHVWPLVVVGALQWPACADNFIRQWTGGVCPCLKKCHQLEPTFQAKSNDLFVQSSTRRSRPPRFTKSKSLGDKQFFPGFEDFERAVSGNKTIDDSFRCSCDKECHLYGDCCSPANHVCPTTGNDSFSRNFDEVKTPVQKQV